MRILVCASDAPLPPPTGLRLVIDALVAELRRDHEVRVIALRSPDQSEPVDGNALTLVEPDRGGLLVEVTSQVGAVARRRPRGVDRLAQLMTPPLTEALDTFVPDVVHVTAGRLAAVGRALSGTPSVIVPLDAAHLGVESRALASAGLKRRLLLREAGQMRDFEASEYRRFGRVIVVSEPDREALESLDSRLRVTVIPNGVDASFYAPHAPTDTDANRIVFTGVMSSPPNVVAAERLASRILPLVRAARPDAHLALVGREPPARVSALAAIPGVTVTGEVPDVRPWLTGSRAFVCPMAIGSGIKNKLLEAMASALPCIATPLALGGLAARPGHELLVADADEEIAAEIVRVLDDDGLAHRLGDAARAYVLAHHTWSDTAAAYVRVYREVCAKD